MENLMVIARQLSDGRPAPATIDPPVSATNAPSEFVSHVVAAVAGAVVLAEITNNQRRTTTVVVEPNVVIGGENA